MRATHRRTEKLFPPGEEPRKVTKIDPDGATTRIHCAKSADGSAVAIPAKWRLACGSIVPRRLEDGRCHG